MPYVPELGDSLTIGVTRYEIADDPAAPGTPLRRAGQQSVIYLLRSPDGARHALKVFEPRFRTGRLAGVSERFADLAGLPGLQVCKRTVLTPSSHPALLRQHPDLTYAVLMPWVEWPTWADVLQSKSDASAKITAAQSLRLARSLANILTALDERGVAHCDLSASNVMLPGLRRSGDSWVETDADSPVALVDVEQMYVPGIDRPGMVSPGSPGYLPRGATEIPWGPNGDRFAGSVLLAEMLGASDADVRESAWGDSYFDPAEMQVEDERYKCLRLVMRERWGKRVSALFKHAWQGDPPTFGEWSVTLPESAPAEGPGSGTLTLKGNEAVISALADLGRQLERDGDLHGALAAFRQAHSYSTPESNRALEVTRRLRAVEARVAEQTAPAAIVAAPIVVAQAPISLAAPKPPVTSAPVVDAQAAKPTVMPAEAPSPAPVPPVVVPTLVPRVTPPPTQAPAPSAVEVPASAPVLPPVAPTPLAQTSVTATVPPVAIPPVAQTSAPAIVVPMATLPSVTQAPVAATVPPAAIPPAAQASAPATAVPAATLPSVTQPPVAATVPPAAIPPVVRAAASAPSAVAPGVMPPAAQTPTVRPSVPPATPPPTRVVSPPPPTWPKARTQPEEEHRHWSVLGCVAVLILGIVVGGWLYFRLVQPNRAALGGVVPFLAAPSAQVTPGAPPQQDQGQGQAPGQGTFVPRRGGQGASTGAITGTVTSLTPGAPRRGGGRPGGTPQGAPGSAPGAPTGGLQPGALGQPPESAGPAPAIGLTATLSGPDEAPAVAPTTSGALLLGGEHGPVLTPTGATGAVEATLALTRTRPGATGAFTRTRGTPALGPTVAPTDTPLPLPTETPSPTPAPSFSTGMTTTRSVDNMEMVAVPGGSFEMGTGETDWPAVLATCKASGLDCQPTWVANEQPTHTVTLSPYWIDRTEVTAADFAAFLDASGVKSADGTAYINLNSADVPISGSGGKYLAKAGRDTYPVVRVYQSGAEAYCQWAEARLPTEAEWEYAARGPEHRIYPWGNRFDGTIVNDWSASDGYTQTAPVGVYPEGASWVGALEMSGNAAEWVADWFAPYTAEPATDTKGPATGELRIVRGGSAYNSPFDVRSSVRGAINPGDTNGGVGFRCAKSAG
jgi:formylglycine-generating enzyme required for sulfatase activity